MRNMGQREQKRGCYWLQSSVIADQTPHGSVHKINGLVKKKFWYESGAKLCPRHLSDFSWYLWVVGQIAIRPLKLEKERLFVTFCAE